MFIILVCLLIGCGNPNTQPDEQTQESKRITQVGQPPLEPSPPPSHQRGEYMYKFLVAEVAVQRGQFDLSAQYFVDLAKESHDPRFAERATQIAMYINEYKLALQTTQVWVNLEPDNFNARQLLSNLLLHFDRVDEALTHLEIVLNAFKDDVDKRLQILTLLVEQPANFNHVLELIRKLLVKRPNDISVLVIYAHLLINDNKLERALRIVNQLLDIDPNHEQGVLLYAHVLDKQDKLEHALLWLKQKLHDKPDREEWRLLYARLLVKNEKFTEAIEQFQQLLQKNPNEPEIIRTLGLLALQTEQLSTAKSYFNQLLNNKEVVDTARFYMGQISEKEDNLAEALQWYRAVASGSFYLSAQISIASILFEQGHIDEGRKHLHNISGLDERELLTLIQAEANLLIEQERFAEAMVVYNKALEKYPKNVDLLYMRAMLAEKMERLDLLEKDLRYILVLEPDNVEALNALGYTLTDQTQRYQEAYQLIKRALAVNTADEPFHVLDSMGWVLYHLKNYEEAIIYLRKAQAKQNDSEVAAHLGEVLWVSGQPELAKEVWEKALEDFPDDEKLQEVMQKFLKGSL